MLAAHVYRLGALGIKGHGWHFRSRSYEGTKNLPDRQHLWLKVLDVDAHTHKLKYIGDGRFYVVRKRDLFPLYILDVTAGNGESGADAGRLRVVA